MLKSKIGICSQHQAPSDKELEEASKMNMSAYKGLDTFIVELQKTPGKKLGMGVGFEAE